ncbi:DsbA family protein [Aerococcaceae bacterium WGS1372]
MEITIWSDFVCPFCYIGESHLKKAIKNVDIPEDFEIEYRSFQLDPTGYYIPNKSYAETLSEFKGMPLEQAEAMTVHVKEMAEATGLEVNYEQAVYANTLDAHRVFQYAKEIGLGNEYFNRFYRAHFVDGANLEDHNTILNIAQELGLDTQLVEKILNDSSKYQDDVRGNISLATSIGVQGVPFFVFNEKYAVSGAQPVELFEDVIKKVYSESKE